MGFRVGDFDRMVLKIKVNFSRSWGHFFKLEFSKSKIRYTFLDLGSAFLVLVHFPDHEETF